MIKGPPEICLGNKGYGEEDSSDHGDEPIRIGRKPIGVRKKLLKREKEEKMNIFQFE